MTAAAGSPPGRIVVRLPNWIGDIVMATPLLRALRQAWPGSQLIIVRGAGHSANDPGMSESLIAATDRFAAR